MTGVELLPIEVLCDNQLSRLMSLSPFHLSATAVRTPPLQRGSRAARALFRIRLL
jgi:hypothetical protein